MKELYGSMDADKAATEVLKWQCEKDTGIPYDSIKEEFINEELSPEQVIKLLTKYGGKTEEKAEEDMLKWKSERDTGIAVDDIQAFYDAGEISAEEVLRMQTEYNGKTEEEAEALLAKYDFVDGNYALNDISNSAVAGYNEHVRDTGISSSDFYTYWRGMNQTEGGKERILVYIDSLPLTVAQKDALYRFRGWAESNLRNAPWH